MDDRTLTRISLIGSILGVALLFLISGNISVTEKTIAQLDSVPEGQEIEVKGIVMRVSDKDKVAFLDVAQQRTDKVTVVLFKDRNITLHEGEFVTVVGSVDEYNGKKEIMGNKVEVTS